VRIDFAPAHAGADGGDFGLVRGTAVLDGQHLDIDGEGFAASGPGAAVWPRLRIAVRVPRTGRLSLTIGLPDGSASGFLCQAGCHQAVVRAAARLGGEGDALDGLTLDVELAGGDRLVVRPEVVHRLPVVRGAAATPLRLVYASCRVAGVPGLAGWCELGGI
jgi:hypothetical protein